MYTALSFRNSMFSPQCIYLFCVDLRSNCHKLCSCCWFGQRWPSDHIKNDNRIFEHPQDPSSSNSGSGFWKEKDVCTFCSTPHDTWATGTSSYILSSTIAMADTDKTFYKKIITEDETWCSASNPETKRQGFEWVCWDIRLAEGNESQMSRITTMLIIFSNLTAQCTRNPCQMEKQ